jgi:hypothetical protein
LALSCALLLFVMVAALAAVAAWAVAQHGNMGLWAALVAWLLCTGAALIALIVSATFAGTEHALSANLGVMLVRMGAPLVGMAILPQQLPQLAEAGLTSSILLFYLVALVAETLLALRHVAKSPVRSTCPLEAR